MREIKFRAWYPNVKQMIHFNDCKVGCDIEQKWALMFYPEEGYVFMESGELMQYTGLHDKNGKEIYEGDIVNVEDHTDKYTVELEEQRAFYYYKGVHSDTNCMTTFKSTVIGNIHENPELLEDKP